LSDISNLLGEDWVFLASELGITTSDVNLVKSECPSSVAQQAMAMLRLWLQQAGNKATGKLYLSNKCVMNIIIYNKVLVHRCLLGL
jgi:ankyrin